MICTCTAFVILLSGLYDTGRDGIILTKYAFESHIGAGGGYFVTAAIFLFAFSTIIANYFYGETNIRFITSGKMSIFTFRVISGFVVMAGALVSLQTAWSFVDLAMGAMTLVNLIAIIRLSPRVFMLLDDYRSQRRQGLDPHFSKKSLPDNIAADVECWE